MFQRELCNNFKRWGTIFLIAPKQKTYCGTCFNILCYCKPLQQLFKGSGKPCIHVYEMFGLMVRGFCCCCCFKSLLKRHSFKKFHLSKVISKWNVLQQIAALSFSMQFPILFCMVLAGVYSVLS